jgi:hypothetical protein
MHQGRERAGIFTFERAARFIDEARKAGTSPNNSITHAMRRTPGRSALSTPRECL